MSGFVLAALLAAMGQPGQEQSFSFGDLWDPAPGPWTPYSDAWVVAPSREGAMTAEDLRARKTLNKLVQKNQSDQFRKYYSVALPNKPTGLPDDYDVLMYGEWTDVLRMRLEIHVRGDRVTAEMVTADGFYRGPLPPEPIDHLARQLAYGFCAERKRTPAALPALIGSFEGWSSIHYVRFQRIELISRDPQRPFHLRTEPWQLTTHWVAIDDHGVAGFAHTRFGEGVERLVRKKLKLLKPTDELRGEVVARLQQIEAPKKPAADDESGDADSGESEWREWEIRQQKRPLDDMFRDDLASVEAKLYARLAVHWRLEKALPELRRLGLKEAALRLAIVTADDPTDLLKGALLTEDDEDRTEDDCLVEWSLNYVSRLPDEKRTEVLLHAMPRVQCGYRADDILQQLADCQLNAGQLAQIDKFYNETADLRSQVAAARCLLKQTNQDEYYRFLLERARKWPESAESTGNLSFPPEDDAFRAVVAYSAKQGKYRRETAEMVRSLFGRMPEDPLLRSLGELERAEDVELLLKYCEHEDESLVPVAIMALAKIEPDLALEKAHRQIADYLHDKRSFHHGVRPYFDMIFWRNDRSAVEPLEAALAKYRKELKENAEKWGTSPGQTWDPWGDQPEVLISYLKADAIEERARHAARYARRTPMVLFLYFTPDRGQWLKEVGMRLVREGADPKKCKPLLKPPPPPSPSREYESWTSE